MGVMPVDDPIMVEASPEVRLVKRVIIITTDSIVIVVKRLDQVAKRLITRDNVGVEENQLVAARRAYPLVTTVRRAAILLVSQRRQVRNGVPRFRNGRLRIDDDDKNLEVDQFNGV